MISDQVRPVSEVRDAIRDDVIKLMTIRAKLLVVLAAVGIASAGIISWTSYHTARDAITENSFEFFIIDDYIFNNPIGL